MLRVDKYIFINICILILANSMLINIVNDTIVNNLYFTFIIPKQNYVITNYIISNT